LPLSKLKYTLSSFEINNVITLLVGFSLSEIELGVSTLTGSCGLNVVVNIKNVSNKANRSTIGVMSIRGDLTGNFIFAINDQF
jgi:uncharacterized membrane protein